MRKLRKRIVAVICFIGISVSSISHCFANTQDLYSYENVEILETVVNTYSDRTPVVSLENLCFAKSMGDVYFSLVFEKNKMVYDDVWELYRQYKRLICDQNGDFRIFSKQQMSDAILFATLFSIDARNICGYSLLDELLGEENTRQIELEGIESTCYAYISLTCHEKYQAMSKAEQEYLLGKILNYSYDTIAEVSLALVASANANNDAELQKWQENKMEQLVRLYQNKACTIEEMAQIILAASMLDIDVTKDSRFLKNGENILRDFYRGIAMEVKEDKQLDAEWLTNVINALLSRENFLRQDDGLYCYGDKKLHADKNYIDTEIYNYLLNESDISNHWSRQIFIKMILDSEIPYHYMESKDLFPNATMTRGEFITWLSQARHVQASEKNYFLNLQNKELRQIVNGFLEAYVFKPYHSEAQRKAFVSYYFGTNFRPNERITREEAAFFIACSYGNIDIDPYAQEEDYQELFYEFQDYGDCRNKYVSAIRFCIGYGFMTGRENRIEPKALLTKAEAVTLINGRR